MRPNVLCIILLACAPFPGQAQEVSFEKDVLPIFRQHCFECHGEGNNDGELALDTLDSVSQGGHTGNKLLAKELDDSELYLRITSKSEGYRMPKRGAALSASDIETISNWITQVSGTLKSGVAIAAPQSPAGVDNATRSSRGDPKARARTYISGMQKSQVAMFVGSLTIIGALVAWLLTRFTENRRRRDGGSRSTSRLASFCYTMIGAMTLLLLMSVAWLYYRNTQLVSQNRLLQAKLASVDSKVAPTVVIDAENLPHPPHPMHPPRLGGQYYRGNDERDPGLFNNGFYRTATIDLHLVDSEGNRLNWNDDINGDVSVEIEIRRAANATRELFKLRVLDQISIEHYSQSVPGFYKQHKFKVVEKEEVWSATIPLPRTENWSPGRRLTGLVYLMYGVQPGEGRHPRPHFAVKYDLLNSNSRISPTSELWMGSMYTLGNRVLVPDENKILLDRWFDWRPIPEIEGEGASDPKLLGVEEHVGKE